LRFDAQRETADALFHAPQRIFHLTVSATERSSDGPLPLVAAGPERADQGGGHDAGEAHRRMSSN